MSKTRAFSALAGRTGGEMRDAGWVVLGRIPLPASRIPASRSKTSFRTPAASAAREMYSSRVIGSVAARIVGSSRSSARRRPGRVPKNPLRSRIWIFRSSTSTASLRISSNPAAPFFCTRVSGSSPSGSVATLTRSPSRSSSSPARNVARRPGSSESYSRITWGAWRFTSWACSGVSPVPSGATTSSIPAREGRSTSKYPSTRIARSALRIACFATCRLYSSFPLWKIGVSGELRYLGSPSPRIGTGRTALRNGDPHPTRHLAYGGGIIHAELLHEKRENVPTRVAHETVEHPLARDDGEVAVGAPVKRTRSAEIGPGALELDVLPDDSYDVGGLADLLDHVVGDEAHARNSTSVTPWPPWFGGANPKRFTRGSAERTSCTNSRRAPVPLPWTTRR